MLMRSDPFRDFDRLAQQAFGTRLRPTAMPMDAYRQGDRFLVRFDLPGVDPSSIDLTVEIVDASGASARVTLSDYGAVRRPLPIRVYRRGDWEERFASDSEVVLQTYVLPLADFSGVDPRSLREVRFVFDRATAGTVVIDDIGFGTPRAAFLRALIAGEDP